MSEDLNQFWNYLEDLPRKKRLSLAEEELLDVRGLSVVKKILYKYNLTHVAIDHQLRMSFKKSNRDCPRVTFNKSKE